MSPPPPQVGDTVLIRAGQHKGKIGTLVRTKEHSGSDGHWYVGFVLLPNGKRAGPINVSKLEKIDAPPDAD